MKAQERGRVPPPEAPPAVLLLPTDLQQQLGLLLQLGLGELRQLLEGPACALLCRPQPLLVVLLHPSVLTLKVLVPLVLHNQLLAAGEPCVRDRQGGSL